jgi:uncharacterized Fe-S cluster-containing radical SAM superfamily protein
MKLSDYGYKLLAIETKHVCNMRCKFCPYPNVNKIGSELSTELFYKIIDSLEKDDKLDMICLEKYNEPLLDHRIFDFNKYVLDKGFKTQIITNGLLFNSKEIRTKLLDSEPTYILISLQILDKENFGKIRGIKTSFEEYKKNLFIFLREFVDSGCKSEITIDLGCNFLSDSIFSKTGKITTKLLGIERGDPTVPDQTKDIRDDLNDFLKDLNTYNSSFIFDENKINKFLENTNPDYYLQTPLKISEKVFIKIKQFIFGDRQIKFHRAFVSLGCPSTIISINSTGSVSTCCIDNTGGDGSLIL